MYNKIISMLALSALIFSVAAQNYMFPSSNPPANLKPSEIQQYVCLMWDDVAYSGRKGTPYETAPNQKWADISRVEGYQFKTWHTSKNALNLKQGDIGASWAISKVLPMGNNPDGSKRTMNFYVITGQMAPITWKTGWVENPQSGDVWGWKNETFTTVNWADPTKTVLAPVCWGREYEVLTNGGADKEEEPHTVNMYKEILAAGHGMGCHTIDHMETNSGMPKKYFTANSGEGFDPGAGAEVDLNGKPWKEQYAAWDVIGWDYLAGCKISKECWKGALQLAEAELTQYLSISVANGKLLGFRAPRLEMNSNGLFALKELGYTYDCSIEEGFEENMNGANAPWPYTFDNGSPSHWTRKDAGEKIPFEQYPAGLWEVPVGIFIVPEDIRDTVWAHGNEINSNAPDQEDWEPLDSWKQHGRITAFDFNMFILWGMTKEHFVKTLEYNLDLRMQNNKAPFCMGIHCDYFTPMYDYATLLSDYNKTSYGLVVTKNWNTWKTRQEAIIEFAQYAQSKGCNFISADQLITKMRELQALDKPGTEYVYNTAKWEFVKTGTSTTNTQSYTGNITNANITVAAGEVYCGYEVYEGPGRFTGLTHIALTYNTTAPIKVLLQMNNDKPWEVTLNNVNADINSGKIPLSAFHYNPNDLGTQTQINTTNIESIVIEVAIPNLTAQQSVTLNVRDVKLYGANPSGIISIFHNTLYSGISVKGFAKNSLKLDLNHAGKYSVTVLSANGRAVQTFNNVNLRAGVNTLALNNLSSGVYLINVSSMKMQRAVKAIIQ